MNVSAAARSTGMPRRLGGGRRAVFEKSDRREAGQASDLGGHVGLVGVTGVEGEVDQGRSDPIAAPRSAGGAASAWSRRKRSTRASILGP